MCIGYTTLRNIQISRKISWNDRSAYPGIRLAKLRKSTKDLKGYQGQVIKIRTGYFLNASSYGWLHTNLLGKHDFKRARTGHWS
jgi:hypothetical protein